MLTKDEAAEELIHWHFSLDSEITDIYRFLAPDEDDANEPIKLLEVNPETRETGFVGPFTFGAAPDAPYPMSIALVTPTEMAQVKAGKIPLPTRWSLDSAKHYLPQKNSNGKG